MSIAQNIRVEDYATPVIEAKMARCEPKVWLHEIAASLAQFWHDHIKALGPNAKYPGQSTGFWEKAADSVHYDFPADNQSELIADHQGIAQRFYGGTIRPVNAPMLIFPIEQESYGKTYGEMKAQLGVAERHKSAGVKKHAPGDASFAKPGGSPMKGLFAFAKSVTQQGNPNVVPSEEEFAEVALARLEGAL